MRRSLLRFLSLAALALAALAAPPEAGASSALACNMPSPSHFCVDNASYVRYWCNAVCPGYSGYSCNEGYLTCFKDPN